MKRFLFLPFFFLPLTVNSTSTLIPCITKETRSINAIDLCKRDGERDFAFTGRRELYSDIGSFTSNLIPVKRNSKWGVIIRETSPQIIYKCIGKCYGAQAQSRHFIRIPFEYNLIPFCNDRYCISFKKGKAGVIDKDNKPVVDFIYDYLEHSDDLLLAKQNNSAGFINIDGKEIIPLKYDDAKPFSEGLAAVYLAKKCGYIDKNAKTIIPIVYNNCHSFTEGLAAVQKDNKWGYIRQDGKVAIELKYDKANPFNEGIATVKENNKWYIIDKNEKKLKEIDADEIYPFSCGLARFKKGHHYGFIDKDGVVKIEPTLNEAQDFKGCLAKAKRSGKNIIIDSFGRQLLTDYEGTLEKGNYIIVEKNAKKGVIDKELNDIILPKFDDIKIIDDNTFLVKNSSYWTFISTDLKKLSDEFEDVDVEITRLVPNMARIYKAGGWGVFDIKERKIILPTIYQEIVIHYYYIQAKKENKYGLFDKTGNPVIPIEYDDFDYISEDLVTFKRDRRYGVYSVKERREVIPAKYKNILILKEFGEIEAKDEKDKKICFNFHDFQEIKCNF